MAEKIRKPRGFAAMSPEKRLAAARKGGKNVPAEKRFFSQEPDAAREAGAKGAASQMRRASDTGQ